MGVLDSFERRLQGMVAATFARLFGGSVHPTEVADALQREASSHLQDQAGRIIAPNRYTVRLGPTDSDGVGQDEERVASVLSTMIREYLDEQGWQTFGDVAVTLEESDALHTGQFRISSLVDPDVDRRSAHRSAGVRSMTHQPDDGAQRSSAQPSGGSHPAGSAGSSDESPAGAPPPYSGPSYGQPSHSQRAHEQPAYGQPGHPQPAYGQPAHEQPAYGSSPDSPPSYGAPLYGQPSYGAPFYGQPSYSPPAYGPPSYGRPANDAQSPSPQSYEQTSHEQPPYSRESNGQPSYDQPFYGQQNPPIYQPGDDPGQAPDHGHQPSAYPSAAPYAGPPYAGPPYAAPPDSYGDQISDSSGTPGYPAPPVPGYPGYPPGYGPTPVPPPDYPAAQPGADQQGRSAPWPQHYGPPDYGQYRPSYQQPPADLQAVLSVDDGSHRTYLLQRGSNIVGRGQDASFRLPDTSVSRRHLDIYFDGQVAVMHDLGSTNGTSVNGSNVQTWQLADGDVVRVGHSTVVFNFHR